MSRSKLKVIFIGGSGRSGSTLLDRILGQIEGFFSLGEMYHIWERSFIENQLCGCGKPFKECEFWQEVVEKAFGGFDKIDPNSVLQLRRSVQRIRYIPWLAFPALRSHQYKEKLAEYTEIWSRLYEAIRDASRSDILIDSSKEPTHGFFLSTIPEVDLYVIHLVRDGRAVAYSWQRKKRRPEIHWEEAYMPRYSIRRSTREWVLSNVLTQILGLVAPHYTIVRYEDLVTYPERTVIGLLKDLGLEASGVGTLLKNRIIDLGVNHTVSGNPLRFKQGTIEIRLDEEWQQRMPAHKRIAVTAFTWPFLLRYGYFRVRRG